MNPSNPTNPSNPMNPSNSSNSMNPSNPINLLTIDLEDYFQVHAFSNVVRFEDWGSYESRIERNTLRILEILNGLPQSSVLKPQSSDLAPNDSRLTPDGSVLSSEYVNSLPQSSVLSPKGLNLAPCSMPYALCGSPKATFFCLGWLAERYPQLIREIHQNKYEIASHGYNHGLIYNMTPNKFRQDVRKSKQILEDITGEEVIGYRAPSYSITNKSQWAFEVLMEEGFKYDSSIFPIHHDFYGFPEAPRFPFLISLNGNDNFEFSLLNFDVKETVSSINSSNPINSSNSTNPSNSTTQSSVLSPHHSVLSPQSSSLNGLLEFPLSTVRICGQNIPISGGGYFRLFPYPLMKKGLRRINEQEKQPFIFYIHPWELDFEQPRIDSISVLSRFRHYVNLHKTEERLKKLLADFRFSSMKEVIKLNNSITQRTQ